MATTFSRSRMRRLGDGLPDHRAAAAPAGAGAERRAVGVALAHGDVVEVDAEVLGHELRGRRLESLAVRTGTDEHVDAPVGVHAHVRGLVGVRRDARLRFHVDREADPQVAAFGGGARLLGAERVVPDLGRRLLEGLLGRHVLDDHAAG